MMAVSEENVKEQEIIQDDFKKAKEIMDRIKRQKIFKGMMPDLNPILFVLCLIYCRQLSHHKHEEQRKGE